MQKDFFDSIATQLGHSQPVAFTGDNKKALSLN